MQQKKQNGLGCVWNTTPLKIQSCILVSERLSVDRAVRYVKGHADVSTNPDGSEDASWETQRHFRNREEAKEADRVYANARFKIRAKCAFTPIGYVCPKEKEDELKTAIDEARALVDEANTKFKHCRIKFCVALADLRPDDGASTAFRDALDNCVVQLKSSLTEFDYKRARNVLSATKVMVDVLKDSEAKRALVEIRDEARRLATEIADVVKQYDDNIENAIVSSNGRKVLARTYAAWNF